MEVLTSNGIILLNQRNLTVKTLTILESGISDMCPSFDDPNLTVSDIQKIHQ